MELTSTIDQPSKAPNSVGHENLFQAFNNSFWHSVAAPSIAIDQLVDKVEGKPTTVTQSDLPNERFGSANFFAQGLGEAVGMGTVIFGTEIGLKKLGQISGVLSTVGELTGAQRFGLAASTGFLYGGFMVPVSENTYASNYWENKAIQASVDSALFGFINKNMPRRSTRAISSLDKGPAL